MPSVLLSYDLEPVLDVGMCKRPLSALSEPRSLEQGKSHRECVYMCEPWNNDSHRNASTSYLSKVLLAGFRTSLEQRPVRRFVGVEEV